MVRASKSASIWGHTGEKNSFFFEERNELFRSVEVIFLYVMKTVLLQIVSERRKSMHHEQIISDNSLIYSLREAFWMFLLLSSMILF